MVEATNSSSSAAMLAALQDEDEQDEDMEHLPADPDTLKEFTTVSLRKIAIQLIKQVGGDVDARTKHIPSKGKGQKKLWLDLCTALIKEQNLCKLHVPVSICRHKHQLVEAVNAHGVSVLSLHPTVWDVRVTFKDKWCMLVFFDLETTGLGLYQAQIIQFGAVCALARPGQPLELLGTYMDYVECKMRFPADVTTLTGIKNWHQEGSRLRGAPTLSVVNKRV